MHEREGILGVGLDVPLVQITDELPDIHPRGQDVLGLDRSALVGDRFGHFLVRATGKGVLVGEFLALPVIRPGIRRHGRVGQVVLSGDLAIRDVLGDGFLLQGRPIDFLRSWHVSLRSVQFYAEISSAREEFRGNPLQRLPVLDWLAVFRLLDRLIEDERHIGRQTERPLDPSLSAGGRLSGERTLRE